MSFTPVTDIKFKIASPRPAPVDPEILTATFSGNIATEAFDFPLDGDIVALEAMLLMIEQLGVFQTTVAQYGLTRSLLAFADHDHALSSAITAVPAVESLVGDRSVKRSGDVVAAVEASIADAVTVFVRKLKARIKHVAARITGKTERLDATLLHIATLKQMLAEGRSFDEDQSKTRQFALVSRAFLFDAFKAIPAAEALVRKLASAKLPDDEVTYKTWLDELRAEFNALSHSVELELNEYGKFEIVQKTVPVTKDTLHGHGYTSLDDFNTVADEIGRIKKATDGFVEGLVALSRKFEHSRNDPTLLYLHKSALVSISAVWNLATWTVWVADPAAVNVIKALFACTEKTK